jgi:hypothetical protein
MEENIQKGIAVKLYLSICKIEINTYFFLKNAFLSVALCYNM